MVAGTRLGLELRVAEALRELGPTGWVVAGEARRMGEVTEWELVRDPRVAPLSPANAPIENFLVRILGDLDTLLFLQGNCDAGAWNISMAAPLARVIPLGLLDRLPGESGGLVELLRRLVETCPPNRYGYT